MKKTFLLLFLGNLASFGPFVTDFYLPSLPELATLFAAPASVVQLSLAASIFGLAIGQLFIGPVSDKYGRRRPLLWSLLLFTFATVGCILSPTIELFNLFRLLQGLTGASGLVISKVVVTDRFSGAEMARYFAILAAVQFIAPILAPVLGGVIFSLTSWRGIFVMLGLWGLALLRCAYKMEETLPAEKRLTIPVVKTFGCFAGLLRNRRFVVMTLLLAFVSAVVFAYISASPFLYQNHFGLSPMRYGLCFACNAVGLVAGSALVMRVRDTAFVLRIGCCGLLAFSVLTSLALLGGWGFLLFEAMLFLMIFCCGVLIPLTTTLALDAEAENKGAAAALLGSLSFLAGGIVAPLVGLGDMLVPTVALFVSASVISLLLARCSRRFDYALAHPERVVHKL